MRICHVIEATGGGSALCVAQLAASQAAQGHAVSLIYAPARMDTQFSQFIAATPGLGIKTLSLPMQRKVGLHDLTAVVQLIRRLKSYGPFDIIHGHSSKAGALVRLAGLMFPDSVKVYTPHAFVTMGDEGSNFYALAERMLGQMVDAIIVLSAKEHEHGREVLHLPAGKLHVVPNGIDIPPTDINRPKDPNKLVIGFVGRLAPQKDPLLALEAFAKLVPGYPQAQLVMIGDGLLADRLSAQITQHGLEKQVVLLGAVVARNHMASFDCLLCSSRYEGFAMIFLEALAAGVPIITTPVGGAHEAVLPGKTGFMINDFQVENLANALHQFIAIDAAERQQMRAAARSHAVNFTVERMAKATEAVYNNVLKRKKRSRQ